METKETNDERLHILANKMYIREAVIALATWQMKIKNKLKSIIFVLFTVTMYNITRFYHYG